MIDFVQWQIFFSWGRMIFWPLDRAVVDTLDILMSPWVFDLFLNHHTKIVLKNHWRGFVSKTIFSCWKCALLQYDYYELNFRSVCLPWQYSVALFRKKWKQTKTSFWRKIQLANYQSMKQFAFCGSALKNQSLYFYDAVYFIV